uniref:PDZ domain-containing protein n=1 Tax=Oryza meridionalis TaxID=40149 RepID=A0A0E0DMF3_9ORYZ
MLALHPAMRSPSPAYNLRPLTSGAREDGSKKLNITNERKLIFGEGGNHLGGGGLRQRWSAAAAGDDLGSGGAVAAGDNLGSGGGQQRLVTASTPAGAAVAGTREERVVDGGIISRGRSKHTVEGVQAEIAVEGVESLLILPMFSDGKEIMQCSGIVVDWNKTSRLATIVTCSAAVCFDGALVHPNPKLLVHLPNRSTAEGQLLFFNAHYRIALLEALVDSPLEPANFGSSPKFGQKVFTLARDKKSSFFARSGTVLLQDPPFFLKYKYWLSLSSAIELCGTGGPAIDERGNVAGMTFGRLPNPDVLSISILQTCIDMWRRFRSTAEGQLLFFNAHYRIALLEALVDSPLEPANFGSSPKFGQKVFTLARDKKSSFFARSGTVLLQDPPFFLKYKYWLSLSSAIELCGTGGPAIDERGNVAGMTFGRLPNPDVLSISILQTCIDMWRRFSRIARPFLRMDLIAFQTLDISHQEEIELEHGITDGFIVDLVCDDSTAGRLGISRGDVIVSYNGLRDFTLHTFEEYLLNLGWGFLESTDPSWTINLELEIFDPVRRTIRGVTFPLGFSDICEDHSIHLKKRAYNLHQDKVKQNQEEPKARL